MKKLVLTIAIVLGIVFGAVGQGLASKNGGGLFKRGLTPDEDFYGANGYRTESEQPMLPYHNRDDHQPAPLGSGTLLLLGFGAAYALKKKQEVRSKK